MAAGTKTVSAEEALADVKRNGRLDSSEPDARLRVMMMSASYLELCDKGGWKFVEKAPKAAIKQSISVLQPMRLKERIEDALELEQSDLEDKYFEFMDFRSEKAVIFEEVHPLRDYRKQNPDHNKIRKNNGKKPGWRTHGSGSGSGGKVNSSSTDGSTRMLPECLNPQCNKLHLVKDCPVTPKELAKKLLEDRRKKNEAKFARVSAVVREGSNSNATASTLSAQVAPVSTDTSAVIYAKIGGHTFVCRIDSGADIVAISEPIVKFLADQGVYLPMIRPTSAELIQAFDGRSVQSQGKVKINPILQTVAGLCCLRNIEAQILPDEGSFVKPGTACPGEIFLGNPFLIRSGLDVKDFLTKNIDRLASIDYGDVTDVEEENSTTVGKLGLKVISNQIAYGSLESIDPDRDLGSNHLCSMVVNGDFPLKDGDGIDYKDVEVGEQEEGEINAAIQAMTDRAAKKLPSDLRHDIKDLVMRFKDIFRIRLGNDPPVSVPPMIIEFEGSERPVKVRQRTYSPDQQSFLKKKVSVLE